MDAVTLDRTLGELVPRVVGRHLSRPRVVGGSAVAFEVGGSRDQRLWLDAGRGTAGIYWLPREATRSLADTPEGAIPGRARQLLLHLRKHLDGARVGSLERIPGERTLVLEAGGAVLALRLGGSAAALSLARDGTVLGSLGEGAEAFPLPAPSPEREWDVLDPGTFEAAVASSQAAGRSLPRAVLAACPGLGPRLAREVDGSGPSLVALRERLRTASPRLAVPGPPGAWHDADLAVPSAVAFSPIALEDPEGGLVLQPASWLEAGAVFLEARRRGLGFESQRRAALEEVRRRLRRLEQLEANLAQDLAGLADEGDLRRRAEALLLGARRLEPGRESVEVPDPHETGRVLTIGLDPRLGGLANAERMFEKARRVERARHQIDLRLRETRSEAVAARETENRLLEARDAGELPGPREDAAAPGAVAAAPRHYLTSRGLSLLVGRNARENHHLTFRVARAEDLWLHARDVPGSHVVLRDNEGRAGATDLREAAEVAAFFSEARGESLVDVHVTRRKHVRPARGGPGRVFVAHSDTLRVPPRDPEGRLRKR
jgi:hypothetical protein